MQSEGLHIRWEILRCEVHCHSLFTALYSILRGVMKHTQTFSQVHFDALNSTNESRRKPAQITGASRSGKGTRARLCCICLCFCQLYHYLSNVHIKPFKPSQSSYAADNQY